jgi:prephenate dehydrogenase
MRIAFLGLGLIGGSIASALRRAGGWSCVAWTPSGEGPRLALAAGAIDGIAATPGEAVRGADIVLLAAPPISCLGLLEALAAPGMLDPRALVTDVASTKGRVVERAAVLGLRFVGGHPMAGRETPGFGAADPDLFVGRPWVIVEPDGRPDPEGVARVEALALATGARPLRMNAAAHDRAVAAISHLPLVASVALVEAVAGGPGEPAPDDWPAAAALAAGGWAGMTRLARGNATMGAGIAATNAPALARRLRAYRDRLDEWLALLEGPDGPDADQLRDRFVAAAARLAERR